jgi:hypothetical protein
MTAHIRFHCSHHPNGLLGLHRVQRIVDALVRAQEQSVQSAVMSQFFTFTFPLSSVHVALQLTL